MFPISKEGFGERWRPTNSLIHIHTDGRIDRKADGQTNTQAAPHLSLSSTLRHTRVAAALRITTARPFVRLRTSPIFAQSREMMVR